MELPIDTRVVLVCAACQSPFTAQNVRKGRRFCSPACRVRHWATNNREQLNAGVRKYRAARYAKEGRWRDEGPLAVEMKPWMLEIKAAPCTDCGGTFPSCCMDFDHREGTTKAYNVGSMFAHHYSRALIESELAKCDLVCSNCHRIRTHDRRTGNGRYKDSGEVHPVAENTTGGTETAANIQ